jgi:hypothetical protein
MSDVWVVRNRGGDIVQITDYEPWEQPDGWKTTRETLLTPEMAAVIAAAKAWAYSDGSEFGLEESEKLFSAVNALRAVEGDA